jgi:hypothetical protein
MAAGISNGLRAHRVLMGAPSGVALKRLRVLHIRIDLPEN